MKAEEVPACEEEVAYTTSMKFKAEGETVYAAAVAISTPLAYTFVNPAQKITVQGTDCASIGDYEITITATVSTVTQTAVFYVRISRDCRCNELSEASAPPTSAEYTYVIKYVGEDALYTVNFASSIEGCPVTFAFTTSAEPALQVGTNMDVLQIDASSSSTSSLSNTQGVLKVNTDVASGSALDTLSTTVTLTATSTGSLKNPAVVTFTIAWKHVCRTATITAPTFDDNQLTTSLLGT